MDKDQSVSGRPIALAAVMMAATIIGLLILLMITVPANAQEECGDFEVMKKTLAEKYGESQAGVGLINSQSVITLFTTPDGESWTMLAADASGRACVLSTGTSWMPIEMPKTPVEGERDS